MYEDCLASTPQVAVNTLRRLSSLQPQGIGIHAWLSHCVGYCRLRDGGRPAFPPAVRDATLLGGSVFRLLQREAGEPACVALTASRLDPAGPGRAIERAFGRPLADVERDWRVSLAGE